MGIFDDDEGDPAAEAAEAAERALEARRVAEAPGRLLRMRGARGTAVVLWAAPARDIGGGQGLNRFEVRYARLDVELPSMDPYLLETKASIPSRFSPDVLPGATIAVHVPNDDAYNVVVLGPAAAAQALTTAGGPVTGTWWERLIASLFGSGAG